MSDDVECLVFGLHEFHNLKWEQLGFGLRCRRHEDYPLRLVKSFHKSRVGLPLSVDGGVVLQEVCLIHDDRVFGEVKTAAVSVETLHRGVYPLLWYGVTPLEVVVCDFLDTLFLSIPQRLVHLQDDDFLTDRLRQTLDEFGLSTTRTRVEIVVFFGQLVKVHHIGEVLSLRDDHRLDTILSEEVFLHRLYIELLILAALHKTDELTLYLRRIAELTRNPLLCPLQIPLEMDVGGTADSRSRVVTVPSQYEEMLVDLDLSVTRDDCG